MITNYRQSLESLEIKDIMHRFVMEKSTGLEKPRNFLIANILFLILFNLETIIWTEADEIPAELEAFTASLTNNTGLAAAAPSAPSSSNSSAVVANMSESTIPTVNDLLGIDDAWSVPYNSNGGSDSVYFFYNLIFFCFFTKSFFRNQAIVTLILVLLNQSLLLITLMYRNFLRG